MFEFTNEVWKRLIWSGLTVLAGLILYGIVMSVARRISLFHDQNLATNTRKGGEHAAGTEKLKKSTQKARSTYAGLFKSLLRLCFVIGISLIILSINGVDVGSILAGIGIASVVMGLAVQDALRDAIRGITIITEKYFQVGDVVTINGVTGVVLSIGIITTKMTDWDHGDAIVSIANRNIVEAEIRTTNTSLSVELPRVMPQVEMARILTDAALLAEKDDKIKTCDYLGVTAVEDGKLKHSFKLTCAPKHAGVAKRIALKQILTTLDENRVPLDEA